MSLDDTGPRKKKLDVFNNSPSFDHLPDIVVLNIFEFLDLKDRGRTAQVCHKWYDISKSSSLWKRVNAKDLTSHQFLEIIPALPSCVFHLRLQCCHIALPLWLPDIMAKLHDRCPSLKTFILDDVFLVKYLFNVIDENNEIRNDSYSLLMDSLKRTTLSKDLVYFCESEYCKEKNFSNCCAVLPELNVLSLRRVFCNYEHFASFITASFLPKLKVLDLSRILGMTTQFIKMVPILSDLEELYLVGCLIDDEGVESVMQTAKKLKVLDIESTTVTEHAIETLKEYGDKLEKLYLGQTVIKNFYLTFGEENTFPKLQVLCVRKTLFTAQYIEELMCFYPSLACVYMNGKKILKRRRGKVSHKRDERDFAIHSFTCDHFKENHYFYE